MKNGAYLASWAAASGAVSAAMAATPGMCTWALAAWAATARTAPLVWCRPPLFDLSQPCGARLINFCIKIY